MNVRRGVLRRTALASLPRGLPRQLSRAARKRLSERLRVERLARAGCLALRYCKQTRALVGLYKARAAHLDEDGGPYVTVCEAHGSVCNHESADLARSHLSSPAGWCEDCATLANQFSEVRS